MGSLLKKLKRRFIRSVEKKGNLFPVDKLVPPRNTASFSCTGAEGALSQQAEECMGGVCVCVLKAVRSWSSWNEWRPAVRAGSRYRGASLGLKHWWAYKPPEGFLPRCWSVVFLSVWLQWGNINSRSVYTRPVLVQDGADHSAVSGAHQIHNKDKSPGFWEEELG